MPNPPTTRRVGKALPKDGLRSPKDRKCLINVLPPELLSHIFFFGAEAEREELEEQDPDIVDIDDTIALGISGAGDSPTDSDSDTEDHSTHSSSDGGSTTSDSPSSSESDKPFELLITSVCKRWREIGIDTPSLWTNIDFSVGGPGFEQQREYLNRSKSSPVIIRIDCTFNEQEKLLIKASTTDEEEDELEAQKLDILKSIIEIVEPHVFHWRTFELMVTKYSLIQHVLERFGGYPQAPLLDTLELYHYEDLEEPVFFSPSEWRDQDFILFNGNAPRLAHVALWGVHLNWEKSLFLSGLRELEMTYHAEDVWPDFRTFARMLKESPGLESLSLRQSGPDGSLRDWTESMLPKDGSALSTPSLTIPLPALKNLDLGYIAPKTVKNLLRCLAIPSLRSISIDFEHGDYSKILEELSRRHPITGQILLAGVERFKVGGLTSSSHSIREVYSVLDNLKFLQCAFLFANESWRNLLMEEWPFPRQVHEQPRHCALEPKDVVYLPKLEELREKGLSALELFELIRFRRKLGVPLKRLFVHLDDRQFVNPDNQAALKKEVETFGFYDDSEYATDDDEELDEEILRFARITRNDAVQEGQVMHVAEHGN